MLGKLKRLFKKRGRRVVYTCLFGYSERFSDFEVVASPEIDYVVFTDDPNLKSKFWNVVLAPFSDIDPPKRSKGFKHRPHVYFPDYSESLYLDNTIRLKISAAEIFDNFMTAGTLIRAFKHPDRDCSYDEAEIVGAIGYDSVDVIARQMEYHRGQDFPTHIGLNATGFLLRRHNDPLVKSTMDTWHAEMMQFSKRDQLSFNFAAWKHSLEISTFAGSLYDNDLMVWELGMPRLPRDFEDHVYLALHPDVKAAGVNPRQHYLHNGLNEGRPYKLP